MCIHVHVHHHSARHATFSPLARGEMHRRENPGSRGTRFFSFHAGRDAPRRRTPVPAPSSETRQADNPGSPGEVMTPVRAASDYFRFMRGEMRRGKEPRFPHRLMQTRQANNPGSPREVMTPVRAASDFLSFSETSCAEAEPPVLSASHLTVFRGVSEITVLQSRCAGYKPRFARRDKKYCSAALVPWRSFSGRDCPATTTPIHSAIVFEARLQHDNPGSFGDHFGGRNFSAATTPVCQAIAFSLLFSSC